MLVDGRKWRLEFHGRAWRIRSKGKGRVVTSSLNGSNLAAAKEAAKKWIAAAQEGRWTLDYTTRAAENARLNAAVRAARSMFLPKYAKPYAACLGSREDNTKKADLALN